MSTHQQRVGAIVQTIIDRLGKDERVTVYDEDDSVVFHLEQTSAVGWHLIRYVRCSEIAEALHPGHIADGIVDSFREKAVRT